MALADLRERVTGVSVSAHLSPRGDRIEPKTVEFIDLLSPQRALFARHPRRESEWGQSAAAGESECFLGCVCAWVCSIYIQQPGPPPPEPV